MGLDTDVWSVDRQALDNRRRLVRLSGRGRFVSVAAAPLYFFLCGNLFFVYLIVRRFPTYECGFSHQYVASL
eukprot:8766662-Pyramimonas_sp.AAC.1